MAPDPLPGPPGIETWEMPFQPHELNTVAATSKVSPCQARWRISRSAPLTGHLQSQQVLAGHLRSARARTPAPASERPAPGPLPAPAAAAGWELAAGSGR